MQGISELNGFFQRDNRGYESKQFSAGNMWYEVSCFRKLIKYYYRLWKQVKVYPVFK